MHYAFVIAAGIFIEILICGGIFFGASGVFIVPVTASLGIGQGEFSMYLTIQSLTMALVMLVAPKLIGRFGFCRLNTLSVFIAALGFALMGFAQNVALLYVGGVLVGFGCVFLTYLVSGTLLPRWFRQKLGTMLALVMSGLGLGGMLFNPVISALINAGGMLGFQEGWRSAYVILGGLVLVICLPVSLFLLREQPSDKGLRPYGEEETVETGSAQQAKGVKKEKAVKSMSFIWYIVMVMAFTLCGPIMTYLPAVAANSPAVEAVSFDLPGFIGSLGMIGAMIGGFVIGWTNDRFGAHMGGLMAGLVGAIGFILMMVGGSTAFGLLGGAALYGIFYQINQVQMPAMVNAMYGQLDYDRIFPVAAMFSPWVGAVSYSLWGFIYDATGNYSAMFVLGIVLSLLTATSGILAVRSSRKL